MGATKGFHHTILFVAWISVLLLLSVSCIAPSYISDGKTQYTLTSIYPCPGRYDPIKETEQLTAGNFLSCFWENSEQVRCYDSGSKYLFDANVISCQNQGTGSIWVVQQQASSGQTATLCIPSPKNYCQDKCQSLIFPPSGRSYPTGRCDSGCESGTRIISDDCPGKSCCCYPSCQDTCKFTHGYDSGYCSQSACASAEYKIATTAGICGNAGNCCCKDEFVTIECRDSDADSNHPDGKNLQTKGSVEVCRNSRCEPGKQDVCQQDTGFLVEYYCEDMKPASQTFSCEGVCADGSCKSVGKCEDCGIFGLWCNRENCLEISEHCYFVDRFGPNTCTPCKDAVCKDYGADIATCQNDPCNIGCTWNNINQSCAQKKTCFTEECQNRIDDDCDGMVDMEDEDCLTCNQGPCCNLSTQIMQPANHICEYRISEQYSCQDGTGCGKDVYISYANRHCSGISAQCTGEIKNGPWQTIQDCNPSQKCSERNPACQEGESENCRDKMDNDCNGEIDFDGANSMHGDINCKIELQAVTAEGTACPNDILKAKCLASEASVSCVRAFIGTNPCLQTGWNGKWAEFDCAVPSAGKTHTITCTVDTSKCYQEGNSPEKEIVIGGSGCCSSYVSQTSCSSDSSCEWCPGCKTSLSSGGSDRCVTKGNCNHVCRAGECSAECDKAKGCKGTHIYSEHACIDKQTLLETEFCMQYSCSGNCICESTENIVQCGSRILAVPAGKTCFQGSIVDCTEGPCCNASTQSFLPATNACKKTESEYRCLDGNKCGDDLYSRHKYQYCSGASAECNGPVKDWSDWIATDCMNSQVCMDGVPACLNQESCTWQCDSGPCCNSIGHKYMVQTYACQVLQAKYTCAEGEGCQKPIYISEKRQYCTGNKESCTGSVIWENPYVYRRCLASEKCVTGKSSCEQDPNCSQ